MIEKLEEFLKIWIINETFKNLSNEWKTERIF